ncbi:MAG TPA: CpsD/CapB family tyrosine-protein kinase [Methylomirabilota bacterium]|jgi:capsular exopolysaccharide synthesis family protein|nr:CpsD/CapB family tyrosine-protein kinase [Methylomirabilota bacterium]
MSKFHKALQQAEQERALRTGLGRARGVAEAPGPSRPPGTDEPAWHGGGPGDGAVSANAPAPGGGRPERGGSPGRTAAVALDGVAEHLVSLVRPASFAAEQYRMLSHAVEQLRETNAVSVVGLSSPGAADGKTVTAINLAGALAQDPRSRVLLFEADLRRPTVARYLGLPPEARGLVAAIAEARLGLADVVTRLPMFNLDVLPAGEASSAPYELLRSERVEALLQQARLQYDHVIVDMAPLVGMPESRLVERLVDGLLVVVSAHRTSRSLLEEALRLVHPAKVVGLVFNGDDRMLAAQARYYRYRGGGRGNGHPEN